MSDDITVGSRWESRDKRDRGRYVIVLSASGEYVNGYVRALSHNPKTGTQRSVTVRRSNWHDLYRIAPVSAGVGSKEQK